MDKKVERVLDLYSRVSAGEVLIKAEEARRYGVNERTVQRDLDDLRAYLASRPEEGRELVYDRKKRGYLLAGDTSERLSNSQILAVCKILLESRSMVREEMYPIIDKLLRACTPREEYRQVEALIGNEKLHYLEPHHGRKFVDALWDIGGAVYEHRLMRIRYRKLKEPDRVMRLIEPVGIMFSEYYFYLCAYICAGEDAPDEVRHPFPTIYRIDRIAEFEVLKALPRLLRRPVPGGGISQAHPVHVRWRAPDGQIQVHGPQHRGRPGPFPHGGDTQLRRARLDRQR